eukprot:TRINITY_DN1282_c0_g1_i1.p3 TRINITY_DN1282_c0_g1~~TRINITY_DN1282_c0_g1_i1.p3  ORF type:complete len:176 (-),score=4.90 TRINITY_DN1282_c0_g1_i1:229-756(-)
MYLFFVQQLEAVRAVLQRIGMYLFFVQQLEAFFLKQNNKIQQERYFKEFVCTFSSLSSFPSDNLIRFSLNYFDLFFLRAINQKTFWFVPFLVTEQKGTFFSLISLLHFYYIIKQQLHKTSEFLCLVFLRLVKLSIYRAQQVDKQYGVSNRKQVLCYYRLDLTVQIWMYKYETHTM